MTSGIFTQEAARLTGGFLHFKNKEGFLLWNPYILYILHVKYYV